jgi:N utilization substance protein A
MDGKELFLIVEAISNEKNISKEEVFISLEEALAVATRKKKGFDVQINIDRKTGDYVTKRQWLVVADDARFIGEHEIEFDPELHIREMDAEGLKVDEYVTEPAENIDFGRIAAQVAKQVIIQKVREAERDVVVDNYSQKVGEVVTVNVKRIDRGNVYVDMGGVDGMISKYDLIPNESLRKGDRVRAFIKEVKSSPRGAQIFLSRTANEMMIRLFEMEVPEISEGVIEIISAARDPGLRSKLSVKAKDKRLDPIGSCIGMRGARVQAVSNELNGERVDIILWDEDPAQFVINAMAPAEVSAIVVDEDRGSMEITVADDQLALAIGRGGQNIKLASKLTGWKLNVMSLTEADEKQAEEDKKALGVLAEQLDVDEEVAGVLIEEGFSSVDAVADADPDSLTNIQEFDGKIVAELQERASDAQLVQAIGDAEASETLQEIEGVDADLVDILFDNEVKNLDDLAELSTDELTDLYNIDSEKAASIIMNAREKAGWFK